MLPARPETIKSKPNDGLSLIVPGSWWRYAGTGVQSLDENEPLIDHHVLMLKDVRVVDGEIHTLILRGHPALSHNSTFRFLLEDFLEKFVHEPNGAAIRERELQIYMDRIDATTALMKDGPKPDEITAIIDQEKADQEKAEREKEEAEARGTDASSPPGQNALVPAALLPSQDVVAAQERVENQIQFMNANQKWLSARTQDIKNDMEIVSRFHMETVDQSMYSISGVQKEAEGLLKNITTMRLFLGEEMEVEKLVQGASAPKSAPLTFLQSMLYLDEEIFISGELSGEFDFSHMGRIEELFVTHPELVTRMMPYERCVVMARIRRDPTPLWMKSGERMTMDELFAGYQEAMLNSRVFLFVRDGENVSMVMADEHTSQAKRLFPSEVEINKIFERGFGDRKRMISPQDLEYTDVRSDHDKTALLYKRFLIILWGLHEREKLFGDFMDEGVNWLEESTHNAHFRFIHDEENVLGMDRLPLHKWIAEKNKNIQQNSRIAVQWNNLINRENAPGMYSSVGRDAFQKASPIQKGAVTLVTKKDDDLIVKCPGESHYGGKRTNFSVALRRPKSRDYTKRVTINGQDFWIPDHPMNGTLCLDDLSIGELDYYIESRINRRENMSKIQMMFDARRLLLDEAKEVNDCLSRISKACPEAPGEHCELALKTWRKWKKWAFPTKDSEFNAIAKLTQSISAIEVDIDNEGEISDAMAVYLSGNGDIIALFDAKCPLPLEAAGIPDPMMQKVIYRLKGRDDLSVKSEEACKGDELEYLPLSLVRDLRPEKLQAKINSAKVPALTDFSSSMLNDLSEICSTRNFSNLQHFMSNIGPITAEDIMREIHHETFYGASSHTKKVYDADLVSAIGTVFLRDQKLANGDPLIFTLEVTIDPKAFLWKKGFENEVEDQVRRIYQNPNRVLSKIKAEETPIRLKLVPISSSNCPLFSEHFEFAEATMHGLILEREGGKTLEELIKSRLLLRYTGFHTSDEEKAELENIIDVKTNVMMSDEAFSIADKVLDGVYFNKSPNVPENR